MSLARSRTPTLLPPQVASLIDEQTFSHITRNLFLTLAANGRIGDSIKVISAYEGKRRSRMRRATQTDYPRSINAFIATDKRAYPSRMICLRCFLRRGVGGS
jgi:hypothetical protein